MSNRRFAERLNQALDEIGVPEKAEERLEIFAKLLQLPKFKAEAILRGKISIDEDLLQKVCEEFDITREDLD